MKRIVINTPFEDKENANEASDKAIQTLNHETTLFENSIKKNENLLKEIGKVITASNHIYNDTNRLIWNVCVTITIGIVVISIFIIIFMVLYAYKNFDIKQL